MPKYMFYDVKRACGHIDKEVPSNTVIVYEPAVLEGKQKEVCYACQKDIADKRNAKAEANEVAAKKYCNDHGIDGHVTAYEDHAEITIYIKA